MAGMEKVNTGRSGNKEDPTERWWKVEEQAGRQAQAKVGVMRREGNQTGHKGQVCTGRRFTAGPAIYRQCLAAGRHLQEPWQFSSFLSRQHRHARHGSSSFHQQIFLPPQQQKVRAGENKA